MGGNAHETGKSNRKCGNVYQIYTSSELSAYLPDFGEMMEIAQLNDVLYVQYTTPDGDMITLGYDTEGQCEKSVYGGSLDQIPQRNPVGKMIVFSCIPAVPVVN